MLGILAARQQAGAVQIPLWLRAAFGVVCAALICLFLWAETLVISGGARAAGSRGEVSDRAGGADPRLGNLPGRWLTVWIRRLTIWRRIRRPSPSCPGGQGSGEDVSEAEAMKSYLLKKGLEDERIIEEDQSVNTDENIAFSRELMDSPPGSGGGA